MARAMLRATKALGHSSRASLAKSIASLSATNSCSWRVGNGRGLSDRQEAQQPSPEVTETGRRSSQQHRSNALQGSQSDMHFHARENQSGQSSTRGCAAEPASPPCPQVESHAEPVRDWEVQSSQQHGKARCLANSTALSPKQAMSQIEPVHPWSSATDFTAEHRLASTLESQESVNAQHPHCEDQRAWNSGYSSLHQALPHGSLLWSTSHLSFQHARSFAAKAAAKQGQDSKKGKGGPPEAIERGSKERLLDACVKGVIAPKAAIDEETLASNTSLAKEYSRLMMAAHRSKQLSESKLLQYKKAAIEAIPEGKLREAAMEPDYSPFPKRMYAPSLTPPLAADVEEVVARAKPVKKLR